MHYKIIHTAFVIFILIATFPLNSQELTEQGWTLEKNRRGVQVYTRPIIGSKLKEYKAFVSIKTDIEKVVLVLQDAENYSSWMVNLRKAKTITKISDTEQYVYSFGSLPWPFNKRDIISHITVYWSENKDTVNITSLGTPDYIPEQTGVLRVQKSGGIWHIYQKDERTIKVEETFNADPGGSVPCWVVNIFAIEGLYKTLSNLKEYLEDQQKPCN